MNECPERVERGGRYLYSVVNTGVELAFGDIGLNDNPVYTIPNKDIAAVVHSCQAEAYRTQDNEKAKEWILSHNYVIDRAGELFGTVLPFAFDCLIKGDDETVKNWLDKNHEKLKSELERVDNKAEYSAHIFCDRRWLAEKLMDKDQELKVLKEKMAKMSKGATYLAERQFELKAKDAIAAEISMLARDFGSKIREHVVELKTETKSSQVSEKYKGKQLMVTLCCLVHKDNVEKLGEVLDEINNRDGFAVRFTGPWAPFSFVDLKED
ncbi:Gas vesicle synthesis protein GvpL/GvpF [uncultured archaeon]|nr:Gas vesicle synthesis protein GvpL/GvpF [uncultured archaeon]